MSTTICPWVEANELARDYHDQEWGGPLLDARMLFEYIVLHTFMVTLSLDIILKRREAFRHLLAGFDPQLLSQFGPSDVEALLANPRIIRNRRKIEASIENAQAWLALAKELGSEDAIPDHFLSFLGGQQRVNRWRSPGQVPGTSPQAEALSKDLKKRGFMLLGPVSCYSLMQTAGFVNDHLITCPRHAECTQVA